MAAEDFSEISDPIERFERNERQERAAIRYVLLSFAAIAAVVAGLALAQATFDVLSASRWELVVVPTGLAVTLAVTCAIKTYRRWANHIRWRPWLFATYAMWILSTGTLISTASLAVVQTGALPG